MQLIVNGEQKDVRSERVDALLGELDYTGAHVSVAVNQDVVPRARWAQTLLQTGDAIEIITPRQGG